MKKIINGKMYDTETAAFVGSDEYSNPRDFHYCYEALYRKKSGEYFIYGEGGPLSKYRKSIDNHAWSGGESIIPMDIDLAREWAEEHLAADDYLDEFGEPEE
ncbi:MAG: hypothetical protein IJV18_08890 [Acidaminococcaceae bacterium]|nr:hypothetical protein [Acidaminococcaceae bacterium]MBQ9255793.1 hypothetical protein [Acidaminococcaceae bacterium]